MILARHGAGVVAAATATAPKPDTPDDVYGGRFWEDAPPKEAPGSRLIGRRSTTPPAAAIGTDRIPRSNNGSIPCVNSGLNDGSSTIRGVTRPLLIPDVQIIQESQPNTHQHFQVLFLPNTHEKASHDINWQGKKLITTQTHQMFVVLARSSNSRFHANIRDT